MNNDTEYDNGSKKFHSIIEDKDYYICESYFIGGSGHTFGIYSTPEFKFRCDNCVVLGTYDKILIVGKKYNYILTKKPDKYEYETTKYSKDILRLEIDNIKTSHTNIMYNSIYLNNEKLASMRDDSQLWRHEVNLRTKIERKKKIIKINNG